MPAANATLRAVCLALVSLVFLWPGRGSAQMPSAYDLRAVATLSGNVAWVSAIQDQGTAEDCWTFASATAMDSNLLQRGLLPTGAVAPAPEVSSWHLSTANGNPNQIDPAKAFATGPSNWGGFEYMALGYVTRGSGQWSIPGDPDPSESVTTLGGGPVSNRANPANVFPAQISNYTGRPDEFPVSPLTPLLPPVDQPSAWRVTNVAILDQGFSNNVQLPEHTGKVSIGGLEYRTYSYTLGAADPQVRAVKEAILANGAVTTSMNADSGFTAIDNPDGSRVEVTIEYVAPVAATRYSTHEVTIIGWDDGRRIASATGTTTGAWLVQNSWGTSFFTNTPVDYTDGTFWAAYDDPVIGRSGVASFQLESMARWSQTVLQNELGPMEYASNFEKIGGSEPAWNGRPTGMATVDSASTVMSILAPGTDGVLAGLGLATQVAGVEVLATIYDWDPATQAFGTLLRQATFANDSIGFFLGELPPVTLVGGRSYAVVLEYGKDGGPLPGAAGVTIGGSGINGYLDGVTPGLSFYLDPHTNRWVDMNTLSFLSYEGSGPDASGGILFLKGYLAVPEPGTLALLLAGTAAAAIAKRRRA